MKGVVKVMKKDERLNKIFDDYAETLTPREELSSKARNAMAASKERSVSSRGKNVWLLNLAWILPVCIVFAVSVFVIRAIVLPDGNDAPFQGESSYPERVEYYASGDVVGKSIGQKEAAQYLDVSVLSTNYQVTGERYYAFYDYLGNLRYIKIYLGLRGVDGVFTEMEIIAERDGYVRNDLKDLYADCVGSNKFLYRADYDESGEYVTRGYFEMNGVHFYVVGRNGQRVYEVEKIISQIMQNSGTKSEK